MVKALQDSAFTSILQRLKVVRPATRQKRRDRRTARDSRATVALLPIDALFRMTARDYASLVAATGGVPIDDRHHGPQLTALGIDSDRWSTTLMKAIRWFGTAVGGPTAGPNAGRLRGDSTSRSHRRRDDLIARADSHRGQDQLRGTARVAATALSLCEPMLLPSIATMNPSRPGLPAPMA